MDVFFIFMTGLKRVWTRLNQRTTGWKFFTWKSAWLKACCSLHIGFQKSIKIVPYFRLCPVDPTASPSVESIMWNPILGTATQDHCLTGLLYTSSMPAYSLSARRTIGHSRNLQLVVRIWRSGIRRDIMISGDQKKGTEKCKISNFCALFWSPFRKLLDRVLGGTFRQWRCQNVAGFGRKFWQGESPKRNFRKTPHILVAEYLDVGLPHAWPDVSREPSNARSYERVTITRSVLNDERVSSALSESQSRCS